MNTIEAIRRGNNGIVTAAIYISCDKVGVVTKKIIEEQVDLIHKFVQAKDIIIIDSYIDRGSRESYNRMVSDAQNKYFDIVLICGNFTSIVGDLVIIDVSADNYIVNSRW